MLAHLISGEPWQVAEVVRGEVFIARATLHQAIKAYREEMLAGFRWKSAAPCSR